MSTSTHRPAPLLINPFQANSVPPESRLFIDATWFMPNIPRRPKEEFESVRLPNARFLDIDEVATRTEEGASLGLKHMMPSPETFARACGKALSSFSRRSALMIYKRGYGHKTQHTCHIVWSHKVINHTIQISQV